MLQQTAKARNQTQDLRSNPNGTLPEETADSFLVQSVSGSHNPAISTERLSKIYPNGTKALEDVSMAVRPDEFVVIIGLSGAGKSTLLRCMNRLIRPTSGRLELFGEDVTNVSGKKLKQVRRKVDMIFQQFHLVQRLRVIENVLVGRLRFNASPVRHTLSLFRCFSRQEKEIAFENLKKVGIADLAFQRADTLSGGQQQRVAIARALTQNPEVFLADEPIASLDPKSAAIVMDTLMETHQEQKIPVIVNLHHKERLTAPNGPSPSPRNWKKFSDWKWKSSPLLIMPASSRPWPTTTSISPTSDPRATPRPQKRPMPRPCSWK